MGGGDFGMDIPVPCGTSGACIPSIVASGPATLCQKHTDKHGNGVKSHVY